MVEHPELFTEHVASPIGTVQIRHDGRALHYLYFVDGVAPDAAAGSPFAQAVVAYLAGEIAALDALPVAVRGTAFETEVWQTLRRIPAGHTWSYRALAETIGRPKAMRAVGAADNSPGTNGWTPSCAPSAWRPPSSPSG